MMSFLAPNAEVSSGRRQEEEGDSTEAVSFQQKRSRRSGRAFQA